MKYARRMMIAALLVFAALPALAAPSASVEQRVDTIKRALAPEKQGGVFDFADLLKSGGENELRDLARRLEGEGLRVWFVTVPPGEPADQVANGVYNGLGMDAQDLLIVFNSRQVYGRSLALQGQPEAFTQAFEESKRAFNEYRAKGLAEYATRLKARIDARATAQRARAAEARQATERSRRLSIIVPLLIVLAAGLLFGFARSRRVATRNQVYATRLREATDLLGAAALEADRHPARAHDARVAELSERLTELRRSPQREDTRGIDLLISDARGLLVDVRKDDQQPTA
jgi:uncharacterized membrane protein YgcG